jgi:hypothetical protein
MIKEGIDDLDKEIIDLIVELRENQTQVVLMKKVFPERHYLNALERTGFRVH